MSVQTITTASTTTFPRIAGPASAKRRRMLLLGLVLSLSTLCGGSLTAHADGSTPFGSFLLHTPTAITAADAPNFVWVVGDYNRDGRPDLYAIKVRRTTAPMLGSPMAEGHILAGQ